MKPLETTIEEVLRDAIQSEVDTRAFYQRLSERAATPDVRRRLLELADLELVHRAKLERRYRDLLSKDAPDPNPPYVGTPDDGTPIDMSRALKLGLERERDAESHFRFMAERAPAGSELANLFIELAETEWQHKAALQAEYDAVSDPEKFLLDI